MAATDKTPPPLAPFAEKKGPSAPWLPAEMAMTTPLSTMRDATTDQALSLKPLPMVMLEVTTSAWDHESVSAGDAGRGRPGQGGGYPGNVGVAKGLDDDLLSRRVDGLLDL